MKSIHFREYDESRDFEAIYNAHCDYCLKTTVYQVYGVSPCTPKEELRKKLAVARGMSNELKVIADENDNIVGTFKKGHLYRVPVRCSFNVTFFEDESFMDEAVRNALCNMFSYQNLQTAYCTVTGNSKALVDSCRKAGMTEVGCFPDYFCYEGELYNQYTFMLRRSEWEENN